MDGGSLRCSEAGCIFSASSGDAFVAHCLTAHPASSPLPATGSSAVSASPQQAFSLPAVPQASASTLAFSFGLPSSGAVGTAAASASTPPPAAAEGSPLLVPGSAAATPVAGCGGAPLLQPLQPLQQASTFSASPFLASFSFGAPSSATGTASASTPTPAAAEAVPGSAAATPVAGSGGAPPLQPPQPLQQASTFSAAPFLASFSFGAPSSATASASTPPPAAAVGASPLVLGSAAAASPAGIGCMQLLQQPPQPLQQEFVFPALPQSSPSSATFSFVPSSAFGAATASASSPPSNAETEAAAALSGSQGIAASVHAALAAAAPGAGAAAAAPAPASAAASGAPSAARGSARVQAALAQLAQEFSPGAQAATAAASPTASATSPFPAFTWTAPPQAAPSGSPAPYLSAALSLHTAPAHNAAHAACAVFRVAIRAGAPMFNAGDHEGCCRLYTSCVSAQLPLLAAAFEGDRVAGAQLPALQGALEVSRGEGPWGDKAWALRRAMDDFLRRSTAPAVAPVGMAGSPTRHAASLGPMHPLPINVHPEHAHALTPRAHGGFCNLCRARPGVFRGCSLCDCELCSRKSIRPRPPHSHTAHAPLINPLPLPPPKQTMSATRASMHAPPRPHTQQPLQPPCP